MSATVIGPYAAGCGSTGIDPTTTVSFLAPNQTLAIVHLAERHINERIILGPVYLESVMA